MRSRPSPHQEEPEPGRGAGAGAGAGVGGGDDDDGGGDGACGDRDAPDATHRDQDGVLEHSVAEGGERTHRLYRRRGVGGSW